MEAFVESDEGAVGHLLGVELFVSDILELISNLDDKVFEVPRPKLSERFAISSFGSLAQRRTAMWQVERGSWKRVEEPQRAMPAINHKSVTLV